MGTSPIHIYCGIKECSKLAAQATRRPSGPREGIPSISDCAMIGREERVGQFRDTQSWIESSYLRGGQYARPDGCQHTWTAGDCTAPSNPIFAQVLRTTSSFSRGTCAICRACATVF